MSSIQSSSAKRLSFYSLLKQHKVIIPIIQRDYAQGRESENEVREEFLKVLFNYLKDDKPNRDLDFVYGSLNETGFILLDGQQRLTTLFLLHWYLAQMSSDNMKKLQEVLLTDNRKSRFTYETRSSSSEFCDALAQTDMDLKNLEKNSLSETIKNSPWYYLSWKYDPTIQSMLTMLDAIHEKFADRKDFFEKLIDNDKPFITFWYLNLEDFNRTDDLYIKMNSRGKPLTYFENFKAKFEQFIEDEIKTNQTNRVFTLKFGNQCRNVSLNKYFSHNIDTKWINLFWNYRPLSKSDDNDEKDMMNFIREIDGKLMNFIRIIFSNQYAMSLEDNETDDNYKILLKTRDAKEQLENISFYKYLELQALNCDSTLYLVDAFDCLVNSNRKIKILLSDSYKYYFDENEIFEKALKNQFSNNQERVQFHAYIRFLIFNRENRSGIEQWMRVIHNLACNTIIDSATDIIKAINSIEKMLPESNVIIEWLKTNPTISFFSREQVLEEKEKAHLITKNEKWKNEIESAEKCRYLDGQIGFILEWGKEGNDYNIDIFTNYVQKMSELFSSNFRNNYNCLFQRALFAIGDYIGEINDSLTFCNFNTGIRDKIDNWRKVFNDANKSNFLIQLLEKISKDNIKNDLEKIVDDYSYDINDWKSLFIKNEGIIEYCNYRFAIWDNNKIALARSGADNWRRHAELYSYTLFRSKLEGKFKRVRYIDSADYDPRVCIDEWHNFAIDVRYDCKDSCFSIDFFDKNKIDIPDEIRDILVSIGYMLQDNNRLIHANIQKDEDFDGIISKIMEITEVLKNHSNKLE